MIEFIVLMIVLSAFFIVDIACIKVSSRLSREEEEHEENSGRIENSFTSINR